MAENFGSSFTIDISQLKKGLSEANSLIRKSESEFKATAATMDDWTESQEGLEARIKYLNDAVSIQKEKVRALTEEYDRQIKNGLNPASKAAIDMETAINREKTALNKNETELKNQKVALKEAKKFLKSTKDETDNLSEGFTVAKGAIADFISDGLQNLIGFAKDGITSLLNLGEETKELRTNMAKLETSFEDAGFTAEDAMDTYKEFYGILGDEGQATEAVAHLSALAKNEEDLAKWTDIATGVYAKFGASLPIENLTEAANETAKTGKLTGGLADSLNWVGIQEERFQKKLDACTTEQERQKLITDTLQGAYSGLAESYRENNEEVINSNKVQAEYMDTLAQLGEIMAPITTAFKELATIGLQTLTPFIKDIAGGISGLLSGTEGAGEQLAGGISGLLKTVVEKITENLPTVINTIVSLLTTLFPTVISAVTTIIPQLLTALSENLPLLLNALITGFLMLVDSVTAMIPTLIPVIIDAVLLIANTLLDNIDQIIDAGIALLIGLADGIAQAYPKLMEKAPVIIEKLVNAIATNLPKILQAGVDIILKLGKGLVDTIPTLVSNIPTILTSMITAFKNGVTDIYDIGVDIVKGLWNGISSMSEWIAKKIKGFGEDVLGGIKDFFGINSPSKLMEEQVGKNLALGIGEGFTKSIGVVNKEISGAMNFENATPTHTNIPTGNTRNNSVQVVNNNYFAKQHTDYEMYKAGKQTEKSIKLMLKGATL
jgi:hypothetical protein